MINATGEYFSMFNQLGNTGHDPISVDTLCSASADVCCKFEDSSPCDYLETELNTIGCYFFYVKTTAKYICIAAISRPSQMYLWSKFEDSIHVAT